MYSRSIVYRIALISLFVSATAEAQVSGETVTVEPAAKLSWSEMLELDAVTRTSVEQRVVPFMTVFDLGTASPASPAPAEEAAEPNSASVVLEGGLDRSPLALTASANFSGLDDNNTSIPPDTMGAAGPSHLMVMLNSQVRILDKTGGVTSTVTLDTFWSSLTGDPFDPKIVYDQRDGRWLATTDADGNETTSQVFFAISDTSDPTGGWSFYQFDSDGDDLEWADYPGFGYNKNWIAITNNMFTVDASPSFVGAKMWVIDKSTALAGGSLTMTTFATSFDELPAGFGGFTLKPCATFGEEETLYIMDNSGLSTGGPFLLRLTQITGTPASPVFSGVPDSGSIFPDFHVFEAANDFNFSQIDAPQSGTSTLVSTNDPRLMNAVFRNGHIWGTHSAGLPILSTADRTVAMWYELDPALLDTTGLPIIQSGAIDGGAGVHHFFPSIAVNSSDDAVVGFSRADSSRFIEAVFTSRNSGDAAGTMSAVTVIKAGEDSYEKTFSGSTVRWGDYSATTIDPSDDLTFWTLQEYAVMDIGETPDDDRWGVWWAKIQEQFTPVYVQAGHAGSNEGTLSDPFTDLQSALDVVSSGGVINIVGGTYDISTPQTITKAMTLNQNGGGNVVVQ